MKYLLLTCWSFFAAGQYMISQGKQITSYIDYKVLPFFYGALHASVMFGLKTILHYHQYCTTFQKLY